MEAPFETSSRLKELFAPLSVKLPVPTKTACVLPPELVMTFPPMIALLLSAILIFALPELDSPLSSSSVVEVPLRLIVNPLPEAILTSSKIVVVPA